MYSKRTWKVDSIFIQTRYRWNLHFIGYPKWRLWSMVGLCEICKNVTLISGADRPICPYSSKACRVSRNKVSHLKVSLERIKWRNKSSGSDFIVVWYPPSSEYAPWRDTFTMKIIHYCTCAVWSNRQQLLGRGNFYKLLCDTGCALLWLIAIEDQCNVNGCSLLTVSWLLMYNNVLLAKNNQLVP